MANLRPIIDIALTRSAKVIEVLSWSGLIGLWLATFMLYADLPDAIPVHFNVAGKIDRLGTKSNIWFLPAITSVLVFGLSILNRFPHKFNYPGEITAENAEQNYKMATGLFRYLKLFIVILFSVILTVTVRSNGQNHTTNGSNSEVVGILLVVMLLPAAILIYIIRQTDKTNSRTNG